MPPKPNFEKMFSPKSVAFIGASVATMNTPTDHIMHYKTLGYPGRIYPVNPKVSEMHGFKCYPTIGSIPETVDFAIISVPRQVVPQILHECADAGVDNIHVYTAGFRETGEREGIELENKVKQIAEERGLSIIGPNGMGPYVPKSHIGTLSGGPSQSGTVGIISQSGSLANTCTNLASGFGVRFSKIISFGNGTVLDSTDFLEYLADDPDTGIIAMYLEGVVDGRKLTELVKEINPHKPVTVLKGGLTDYGARAVASHTGSLAGSASVWNAFFKQTGAVRVDAPEELLDMAAAFLYLHPLRSSRLALLGTGGGMSVNITDTCAREGMVIPSFAEETRIKFKEMVPVAGTSIRNPLDASIIFSDSKTLDKALNLVGADPTNDGILIYRGFRAGISKGPDDGDDARDNFDLISSFAKSNPFRKPLAVVLPSSSHDPVVEAERMKTQSKLADLGVAVFPTFRRAALALRRFADYHEFING